MEKFWMASSLLDVKVQKCDILTEDKLENIGAWTDESRINYLCWLVVQSGLSKNSLVFGNKTSDTTPIQK